jgi:hypothetical protein
VLVTIYFYSAEEGGQGLIYARQVFDHWAAPLAPVDIFNLCMLCFDILKTFVTGERLPIPLPA